MPVSGAPSDRFDERDAALIRAGLERVLDSDAFRAAPQLSAFLNFIVERTIAGRSAELKAYTIAVEAFGRPPDFDPQSSPIVRVEAGRLRKALAQYYGGEGKDDPLRISMPVGAYVPAFSGQAVAMAEEAAEAAAAGAAASDGPAVSAVRDDSHVSRRWWAVAVAALAIGLLALALWHGGRAAPMPAVRDHALQTAIPPAPQSTLAIHLPVVAVTVGDVPGDAASLEAVRRFTQLFVDALARFDDLVVVREVPAGGSIAEGSADYVFDISVNVSGEVQEVFGRLRAAKDGRIVWASSSSRVLEKGAADAQLVELSRRLAIRLAEPFGIIHADFRQASTSPAMACVFQSLDVRRTLKSDNHAAARSCLEALIEKEPTFFPAWAQLAFLIVDEYAVSAPDRSQALLDQALGVAMTAVRLAPSSARGQQAMMDVLFARGMTEEALKAGRAALARNPYDPDIKADLGARYIQLDRASEGLPLLEEAIAFSVGRPSWYDVFAFLGAHLTGNQAAAEAYSAFLVAGDGAFSLLGRALQAAQAGDKAALALQMTRLAETVPQFGADPHLYLSRRGFGGVVIDRIMADLGPEALEMLKRR